MALTDLARAMKEAGKPVIGLAAGEPDFDTPAPIVAAGQAALGSGVTRYTANTGTAELRGAICRKLREENGLEYKPGQVVVTNGAKQAIAQAVIGLCGPGDEVIIPAPFWVSYPEMVRLAGAEPIIVPCSTADGFLLTAAALEAALTPRSRMLILCTPSNPTGAVYPLEALQALAAVAARHPRLVVLSDEIYEHIIYPPAQHHSFAALPGMWERTVTVNGFSKAFAMTGWRMGYLAAPDWAAGAAASIQSQTTSGASSIAQAASVAALAMGPAGGAPVATMVAAFRERRDYICRRIAAWPGVVLSAPAGAFYVMPDVSAYCTGEGSSIGPIADSETLCRYILETSLVAAVPGEAFGAPGTLRISYACSLATLEEALDRIEKALRGLQAWDRNAKAAAK